MNAIPSEAAMTAMTPSKVYVVKIRQLLRLANSIFTPMYAPTAIWQRIVNQEGKLGHVNPDMESMAALRIGPIKKGVGRLILLLSSAANEAKLRTGKAFNGIGVHEISVSVAVGVATVLPPAA